MFQYDVFIFNWEKSVLSKIKHPQVNALLIGSSSAAPVQTTRLQPLWTFINNTPERRQRLHNYMLTLNICTLQSCRTHTGAINIIYYYMCLSLRDVIEIQQAVTELGRGALLRHIIHTPSRFIREIVSFRRVVDRENTDYCPVGRTTPLRVITIPSVLVWANRP